MLGLIYFFSPFKEKEIEIPVTLVRCRGDLGLGFRAAVLQIAHTGPLKLVWCILTESNGGTCDCFRGQVNDNDKVAQEGG